MLRIILLMTLSLLAAKMISMMIGSEAEKEKKEIAFYITSKNGAVGCLSKDKFKEEESYYLSGNLKAAQRLIDEQECFFLPYKTKMFADEKTCSSQDKNEDLFPFKPNDFMMLQPYLPCAAVR